MLVFPAEPEEGEVFSPGSDLPSWTWDGEKWTGGAGGGGGGKLARLSDVDVSQLDANGGELLTYNGTTHKWQPNGHAWLNGGADHDAFTVYGQGNNWTGVFLSLAESDGRGVYVRAAATADTPVFVVANSNFSELLRVAGDGTGGMGVPGFQMLWRSNGSWEIPMANPAVITLTVRGQTYAPALFVVGAQTGAGGQSHGIQIVAGSQQDENAIDCRDWTGGRFYFTVKGDGSILAQHLLTTTASPANMFHDGNGWIMEMVSTHRCKTNIHSMARERARQIVRKLRPVTFNSLCKMDDPQRECYGLVAEEVAEVDPALVSLDKDGKPQSVAYDRIGLMLLPLVQELLGMDEPEETVYG